MPEAITEEKIVLAKLGRRAMNEAELCDTREVAPSTINDLMRRLESEGKVEVVSNSPLTYALKH